MFEINQANLRSAAADLNLPGLQTSFELIPQHRQQHLAVQQRIRMIPADIKIFRIAALGAFGQDIPPPAILPAGGRHVVGHNVQHQPHSQLSRCLPQPIKSFLAPQSGIHLQWVHHVISVSAAGSRFEAWRQIQVADTQAAKIREQIAYPFKCQPRTHLKAICGQHIL